MTGRLALALRADGTVGTPRLGGRATLSGAEYRNAVYGVRVFDLNGTISGDGTRLVIDRIAGRTAGNGTIVLQGSLDAGAPGFPADLTLTARNARPVVSDLVTATLNTDIRVPGPVTGGGTVSGTVRIQQAEIRIPTTLPASVPTLANVRQTGRLPPGVIPAAPPRPPAPPAPPLDLAVTISAPQSIYVRGRGVDVELGGEVKVGGTAAAPVPTGTLNLRRGTLNLIGRQLTFQKGTIGFEPGSLMPSLDLSAQATLRQHHHHGGRAGLAGGAQGDLQLLPRTAAGRGAGAAAVRPLDQQPLALRDRPDRRRGGADDRHRRRCGQSAGQGARAAWAWTGWA